MQGTLKADDTEIGIANCTLLVKDSGRRHGTLRFQAFDRNALASAWMSKHPFEFTLEVAGRHLPVVFTHLEFVEGYGEFEVASVQAGS
jgi:hypothetical protein